MIFHETALAGAYLVEPERIHDVRGFFARTFCKKEFAEHHLDIGLAQCSIAHNTTRGTLRGMHFQTPPHQETKLVRVTRGIAFDVVIDLRADSPTYLQWFATELSMDNRMMIYVPPGLAHGYQTLSDDTEVFYQISTRHAPDAASGVRWNDPCFGIDWPLPVSCITPRDDGFPDWRAS